MFTFVKWMRRSERECIQANQETKFVLAEETGGELTTGLLDPAQLLVGSNLLLRRGKKAKFQILIQWQDLKGDDK